MSRSQLIAEIKKINASFQNNLLWSIVRWLENFAGSAAGAEGSVKFS
jgi:hypothetical protein